MRNKILIIEDDPRQVVFLQDIVEYLGHQALIARDGMEGLEKAKDERPNLIILDIGMPEMDGFKVCEIIRRDALIRDTPILILTAKTHPEDKARGFGVGADGYLTKPYDVTELEKHIEVLLRRTSRPPFPQFSDSCKLYLTCEPGHPIQLRGQGTYTFRGNSQNPLDIDPNIYARHGQNAYQDQQWRFNTKETGKRIYDKIFIEHPRILSVYKEASATVRKSDKLKLYFESSLNFFRVPVEFLFEAHGPGDYLVFKHPITRFIMDISPQNSPLSPDFFNNLWKKKEKLKILLIASNTRPPLQYIDEEVLSLNETLQECLEAKEIPYHIEYIPTEEATFNLVTDKLKKCPYHILHYAGHGTYKELSPERSYLQFWSRENRQGNLDRLNVPALNLLLRNSNLRFVYLSCCQGAETAGGPQLLDDDFPGLVYGIVQAGIASVLGFRWEVSDESAKKLALSFYRSLFTHGDLDLALFEARREIAIRNKDDKTWMSPVLIIQE
jgi:DNA-binding response OmpR family regulator/CHAT domain-containing protein